MCPVTPVPSNDRPDQLINQDCSPQHQNLQIIHLVNYMDHAADHNPLSFPHTFFGLADQNSSHIQKRNALEKY